MEILSLLLIFITPIVAPPIAVWRAWALWGSGRAAWLKIWPALLGPWIATYAAVVLIWLPRYSGQCGGWLGETAPCSGFGQYAVETLYWAAIGTAAPGLFGVILGISTLLFRWIQSSRFRNRL